MYVYKTTNLINGKIYIGISKKKSKNSLLYLGSGKALKRAVSKYGRKNFKKEIIEENDEFSYKDLQNLEKKYIKEYNSTDNNIGYNISQGGDGNCNEVNGMYGKKHSNETKEKIRNTRKIKSDVDPNYGKITEESRLNMSEFMKIRNKEKPTLPNGHSEETKKRISDTVKRKIKTGEIVQKHSKFSEERKKKYSEMFSGSNNPFYGKSPSKESLLKRYETFRKKYYSVKRINIETLEEKIYESLLDVKIDGFRIDCVRLVIEGKRKHHKNYKWEIYENKIK